MHDRRLENTNFYPRSPCGERPFNLFFGFMPYDFYPRSPCGERLSGRSMGTATALFLSTLSLRRATNKQESVDDFIKISIHALLAESDSPLIYFWLYAIRFLSTLSLRRATWLELFLYYQDNNFYPRSPCGERHKPALYQLYDTYAFLSTLSLRRATLMISLLVSTSC